MKNIVHARTVMLRKDSFAEHAYPGSGRMTEYAPIAMTREQRTRQDAKCCPDNLDSEDPQVQVVVDGALVMIRFVDPQGASYERYVGGMDLDFSKFEDGVQRAAKVAEAFLL